MSSSLESERSSGFGASSNIQPEDSGFKTITNEFIPDDISVDYAPSGVAGFDDTTDMPLSIEQMVNDEFSSYLTTPDAELLKNLQGNNPVYEFWKKEQVGARFPLLAQVAMAFLSTKASSAALERDFSPISDIMSPKRSSLKPWFLEILMALKLNMKLLPLDLSRLPPLSKAVLESYGENKKTDAEGEAFLTARCSEVVESVSVSGDSEAGTSAQEENTDDSGSSEAPMTPPKRTCKVVVSSSSSSPEASKQRKKRKTRAIKSSQESPVLGKRKSKRV